MLQTGCVMLNKYPLWKYLLILVVLGIGFIYSAPNLYPDDPAIQLTGASTALKIEQADVARAEQALKDASIAVKAGGETELKPGSFHVMLIDLKEDLKEGGNVPITLKFDDGSSQSLLAPVRKPHTWMPQPAPTHPGAGGH